MDEPLPDAGARALVALDRYAKQDRSLRDEFDETMTEKLSEELLVASWAQVTAAVGELVGRGEPSVGMVQGYTVVDVPLTFERGEMKGRVAYDDAGRIAGLFVLNPTVL